MKEIKRISEMHEYESYLVFIGFEYSPSGYDIATFTFERKLRLQGNGAEINFEACKKIYSLPEN